MITIRFRIGFEPDFDIFSGNRIGSGFHNGIVTELNKDFRDIVTGLNQNSFCLFYLRSTCDELHNHQYQPLISIIENYRQKI